MDILAYYWLISNQGTTDVATRTEPNPKVNKRPRYRPGKSKGAGSPTLTTRPHFKPCIRVMASLPVRISQP